MEFQNLYVHFLSPLPRLAYLGGLKQSNRQRHCSGFLFTVNTGVYQTFETWHTPLHSASQNTPNVGQPHIIHPNPPPLLQYVPHRTPIVRNCIVFPPPPYKEESTLLGSTDMGKCFKSLICASIVRRHWNCSAFNGVLEVIRTRKTPVKGEVAILVNHPL